MKNSFTVETAAEVTPSRLTSWADIHLYVFAGNATFTLRGQRERYTYKVRKAKEQNAKYGTTWFVSLLRGPSNEEDYAYMGVIDNSGFHCTRASLVTADAASHKAFQWFLSRMRQGGAPCETLEFWHCGHCGRCGRKLTVPESVARGIGPECAGRME